MLNESASIFVENCVISQRLRLRLILALVLLLLLLLLLLAGFGCAQFHILYVIRQEIYQCSNIGQRQEKQLLGQFETRFCKGSYPKKF